MTEKTTTQWYVYKDEQQLGPYNWEQLWQEARGNRIFGNTLVWNNEQTGWISAEKIPGLIINSDLETNNPPPPPAKSAPASPGQPKPVKNKTLIIAVAAAALFIVIGVAIISLFLTGDTPETAELFFEFEPVAVEESTEPEQPENDYFASDDIFGWSVAELDDESFQTGEETTADDDNTGESAVEEAETADQTTAETAPPDSSTENATETDTAFPENSNAGEETIPLLGGTYTGPLKDGLAHGEGRWVHPDGRAYVGNFINGRIEGYGTMIFPRGERYVGFLKDGKAHGEGTMIHPDGRTASGIWIDGLLTE